MALPGFLAPLGYGALRELDRQQTESDILTGTIVDTISENILGKEIPEEEALIKAQNAIKDSYIARLGPKAGNALDALGIFESGTDIGVDRAIERFLGQGKSLDSFKESVEALSDKDYNQLLSTSFIGRRETTLKDRKELVGEKLSSTKNIKDLLIGEDKRTGLAKYFTQPITEENKAAVMQRATEGLAGPEMEPVSTISAGDILGLDTRGSTLSTQDALAIYREARQRFNLIYPVQKDTGQLIWATPYDSLIDPDLKGVAKTEAIFNLFVKDFTNTVLGQIGKEPAFKPSVKTTKEGKEVKVPLYPLGKEPVIRENIGYPKSFFDPTITDYMDIPEDAKDYNKQAIERANHAYERITQLQNAEAASGDDQSDNIEIIRNDARKFIISLGEDPRKYGL